MQTTLENLRPRLAAVLTPRAVPSMREWAEQTIVIPDGPYKGQAFDCTTQPFAGLFFDQVDSGRWDTIVATGPTQTGKSLICYVIPVLYHLFAVGETVVAGLPTLDIAQDKWGEDLLPVIEASSELSAQLPRNGEGSRGGRVKARVRFRHGATMRFMTGGGKDKSRAGFTSRVLAITEVDGLDEQGTTSREADKVKQMEARLRAFLKIGIRKYLECTVTKRGGRIWQEYTGGTESRIARPCPHCGDWVTPEREHLVGWQDAESELEAREAAAWSCPSCAALWTEQERYEANLQGVLVHRGQEVTPDGQVTGAVPKTNTLGFRWTAVDNHFATAADVAADEWNALREPDRDNAEKELCQFVHSIPWDPPEIGLLELDPDALCKRPAGHKQGIVPANAVGVAVAVDTGKRVLHWTAKAVLGDTRRFVIDYGEQIVEADRLGVQRALIEALRMLRGYFDAGWQTADGATRLPPDQVWIDSQYHEHTDAVYVFCREANQGTRPGAERYRPSKGYGEGRRDARRYTAPKRINQEISLIGNEYHLARSQRAKQLVAHVNADHWKSQLHQGLLIPPEEPGAIVLYQVADPLEHDEFSKQLAAERQIEHPPGSGRIVWDRIRRQNHFLDSTYAATAICHLILTLRKAQGQQPAGGWFAAQEKKGRR